MYKVIIIIFLYGFMKSKSTSTHYSFISALTHSNSITCHLSIQAWLSLFSSIPFQKNVQDLPPCYFLLHFSLIYDPLPKSNIPIVPLQSQKYTSVTIILTRADWRMGWDGIAFQFNWKHVIVLS